MQRDRRKPEPVPFPPQKVQSKHTNEAYYQSAWMVITLSQWRFRDDFSRIVREEGATALLKGLAPGAAVWHHSLRVRDAKEVDCCEYGEAAAIAIGDKVGEERNGGYDDVWVDGDRSLRRDCYAHRRMIHIIIVTYVECSLLSLSVTFLLLMYAYTNYYGHGILGRM